MVCTYSRKSSENLVNKGTCECEVWFGKWNWSEHPSSWTKKGPWAVTYVEEAGEACASSSRRSCSNSTSAGAGAVLLPHSHLIKLSGQGGKLICSPPPTTTHVSMFVPSQGLPSAEDSELVSTAVTSFIWEWGLLRELYNVGVDLPITDQVTLGIWVCPRQWGAKGGDVSVLGTCERHTRQFRK